MILLCTSQSQNHPCPALPHPLHLTFLKNFSRLVGQMHMPHRLRASNPPPTNDYIKKFSRESLPFYSNVNILLDTTEIFSVSLGKLPYRGFFISVKLFIPESPRYNIKRAFSKALKCSNKTVKIGGMACERGTPF